MVELLVMHSCNRSIRIFHSKWLPHLTHSKAAAERKRKPASVTSAPRPKTNRKAKKCKRSYGDTIKESNGFSNPPYPYLGWNVQWGQRESAHRGGHRGPRQSEGSDGVKLRQGRAINQHASSWTPTFRSGSTSYRSRSWTFEAATLGRRPSWATSSRRPRWGRCVPCRWLRRRLFAELLLLHTKQQVFYFG